MEMSILAFVQRWWRQDRIPISVVRQRSETSAGSGTFVWIMQFAHSVWTTRHLFIRCISSVSDWIERFSRILQSAILMSSRKSSNSSNNLSKPLLLEGVLFWKDIQSQNANHDKCRYSERISIWVWHILKRYFYFFMKRNFWDVLKSWNRKFHGKFLWLSIMRIYRLREKLEGILSGISDRETVESYRIYTFVK